LQLGFSNGVIAMLFTPQPSYGLFTVVLTKEKLDIESAILIAITFILELEPIISRILNSLLF
jgi:hypothetical protein